jgi:5-methylthioadenosine/S-adenosylhomocysteine deaminase
MFSLMRATLMSSHVSPGPRVTTADVLRLATMDGAAVLGMADRIGSLRAGKQADVVLLDATAPNLAGAHDPVAAVVLSAHPGNVDTVLVAGNVVKRDGRLVAKVPDEIAEYAGFFAANG